MGIPTRGKKPDRYEIIGSVVSVSGALIIFYSLR
jgi:drug/metabolite transporter superfamily protein YnfA